MRDPPKKAESVQAVIIMAAQDDYAAKYLDIAPIEKGRAYDAKT
jgi:hypothetical protein